jgi:alkylation response protein AidB-like acyl-CoA dehydrogenase
VTAPATTGEPDPVLAQVVGDVLADPAAHQQPGAYQQPGGGRPPLWRTARELGWPGVGTGEAAGGSGGTLADLATIVRLLAGHPVGVPLVEAAVAHWAAAAAGLGDPAGPEPDRLAVLVLPRAGDELVLRAGRLSGRATRVPWAAAADRLVVAAGETLAVVDPAAAGTGLSPGANLAGEPRDTVSFDAVPVRASAAGPPPDRLAARAGLLRCAGLVGAIERAGALTLAHVQARHQFGKPLLAFQAVGHAMAVIACEREQGRAALALALAAPAGPGRLAAARVVLGRAAGTVARLTHQLHGAIGVTREHDLHRYTGRLLSWRDELGTQRDWTRRLGGQLAAGGSAGLWEWLTGQEVGGYGHGEGDADHR